MRYRRELGVVRVATWIFWPLIVSAGLIREGHPLWIGGLAGVLGFLAFYLPHLFWYWEILPDRLIHRRYFQRVVFRFQEITYVGPMTGKAAGANAVRDWILIQTAGQRMVAQPADPEAFLVHIRKYLPQITLNL